MSGGNIANMVCFLTGRRAMAGEGVRAAGLGPGARFRVYVSTATHTAREGRALDAALRPDHLRTGAHR